MFETRLLRCVVLVVTTVVLAACAHRAAVAPLEGNPCADGKGSGDRQAPIVCVEDTGPTLSVSPDPIVIDDRKKEGSEPVTMQWFTRSGRGDLQIAIEDGCLTELKCSGNGQCVAKTRDVDAQVKCKYDVWTKTHPRLDPDIILTPCC